MQAYEAVYRLLGMPEPLVDCALGRIELPVIGWVTPPSWYGFPPALIPISSNGSGPIYLGYWKHWFSDRGPTFVEMYVGSGRTTVEIARTPAQFFCYVAMAAIVIDEGISPSLERFASVVGIANLNELDAVSLKTGDNPLGFSVLPQFADDLPLSSVKDVGQYTGSFPTGRFTDSRKWWEDACSFELPREVAVAWPSQVPRPPWMLPGPKAEVFDSLLQQGDLHGAWMTLNSSGWSVEDAKIALGKLAQAANNPEFTALALAWAAVADPSSGSY